MSSINEFCQGLTSQDQPDKMDILTLETHAKDLLIYLNELYLGKSLCDVHIRSEDGVYFPAHKIVLASSSLYIYQMVMSNPETTQISLTLPSHVVQTLIEFIYTGKLIVQRYQWLDVQNAATFLQMYNVLDLMKRFELGEVLPTEPGITKDLNTASKPTSNCSEKKSIAKNVETMTTITLMSDWNDGTDETDFSMYRVVKTEKTETESNKTPEVLIRDPDSGPLPRLRPQIRKNFSNMHAEFNTLNYEPPKKKERKSTPKKEGTETGTPPKRKPRRKKRKYKKRVNKYGKEMRYRCWYCRQRFKLLYKRHRHMCKSHTRRYYTRLYSGFSLEKSLRLKTGTLFCQVKIGARKLHRCTLCTRNFSSYSLFAFHYIKRHLSRYKQTWFNYVSEHAQRLPRRNKLKKEFECTKCPKSFISESNLAIHFERYHFDENDRYQMHLLDRLKEKRADNSCKLCGKSYRFRSSLSRHMAHHQTDKPHQCAICGKIFSLKAALKEHAIVHEGGKTCICAVCGKCYKHRQSLRRHMTEHDPDKKVYTCSICGKVYDRNDKLVTHLRTHDSLRDVLAPPPTGVHTPPVTSTLAPPHHPHPHPNPHPSPHQHPHPHPSHMSQVGSLPPQLGFLNSIMNNQC